jgi:hypothetical protein
VHQAQMVERLMSPCAYTPTFFRVPLLTNPCAELFRDDTSTEESFPSQG